MRKTALFIIALSIFLVGNQSIASVGDTNTGVKFSGVLWASYWHSVAGGAGNLTTGTANSFDIKRVYLNASGNLDQDWSWKVTYELGGTPTFPLTPFAKAAFLKWNIPGSLEQSAIFGLQPTMTWATSESLWGYRVVMNSSRELLASTVVGSFMGLSSGSSADIGIGYSIKPIDLIKLGVQISNGSGHKAAETNRYKKISGSASINLMPNSVLELYIDNEAGYNYVDQNGLTQKGSRLGLGLVAGYKVEKFGFGFDYFQKKFPEKTIFQPDGTKLEASSQVISLFGNFAVV